MIQREIRLICRGIQLISVFELDEFYKNPVIALICKEDVKKPLPPMKKETSSLDEPSKDNIHQDRPETIFL